MGWNGKSIFSRFLFHIDSIDVFRMNTSSGLKLSFPFYYLPDDDRCLTWRAYHCSLTIEFADFFSLGYKEILHFSTLRSDAKALKMILSRFLVHSDKVLVYKMVCQKFLSSAWWLYRSDPLEENNCKLFIVVVTTGIEMISFRRKIIKPMVLCVLLTLFPSSSSTLDTIIISDMFIYYDGDDPTSQAKKKPLCWITYSHISSNLICPAIKETFSDSGQI